MKKNIKLHISGLEEDDIKILANKFSNQELIIKNEESNQMHIELPNSLNHSKFIEFLNNFLSGSEKKSIYQLPESCYFDPNNAFIKCIDKKYNLGKRELHFLEMLFFEKSIVTYEQMNKKLWNKKKDFKLNSIRLFVRDIKKKLPKNSITNVQGMGYKLTYQKF